MTAKLPVEIQILFFVHFYVAHSEPLSKVRYKRTSSSVFSIHLSFFFFSFFWQRISLRWLMARWLNFPGDQFQSKRRKQKGTILQEPCLIPWGPNAAVLARCGGRERATSTSCVRLRRTNGSQGGVGGSLIVGPSCRICKIFFSFFFCDNQWSWFEWLLLPKMYIVMSTVIEVKTWHFTAQRGQKKKLFPANLGSCSVALLNYQGAVSI